MGVHGRLDHNRGLRDRDRDGPTVQLHPQISQVAFLLKQQVRCLRQGDPHGVTVSEERAGRTQSVGHLRDPAHDSPRAIRSSRASTHATATAATWTSSARRLSMSSAEIASATSATRMSAHVT